MSKYTRPAALGLAAVSAAALCALAAPARQRSAGSPGRTRTHDQARAADLGRRHAPERPRLVRRQPPELDAGQADPRRHRVHQRGDLEPVGLRPGWHRADDRRQPQVDRRLLRRRVQPQDRRAGRRLHPGPAGHRRRRHLRLARRRAGERQRLHRPGERHLPVVRRERLDLRQRRRHEPGRDHEPEERRRRRSTPRPSRSTRRPARPITPWDYLGDNTIFQVIHNAGLRTAWSDKHAVYMSFNGPGSNGQSIDDFFGPGDRLAGGRAERRPVPAGRRLGPHRRRHQAVRRLQGPGHPERDRRSRPLGQDQGRHPGDLRHELPGRLGRRRRSARPRRR